MYGIFDVIGLNCKLWVHLWEGDWILSETVKRDLFFSQPRPVQKWKMNENDRNIFYGKYVFSSHRVILDLLAGW